MSTSTSTPASTRPRTRTRRRQPSPSQRPDPPSTDRDRRRYLLFRAGTSPEEQAARENVRLDTILQSIQRHSVHLQQFSAESAEVATREMALGLIGQVTSVLEAGLTATVPIYEEQEEYNEETGVTTKRRVLMGVEPDLKQRMRTQEEVREWLASVQPKQPQVAINNNSSTLNDNRMLVAPGHAGTVSFESIVRQIRVEQGQALPSETVGPPDVAIIPVEVDMELEQELEEDEAEEGELVEESEES